MRFRKSLLLLALPFVVLAARPACFLPDGSKESNDLPCFSDDHLSRCCAPDEFCSTNKLCVLKVGATRFARGSCLDKNFGSTCPTFCKGIKDDAKVDLFQCGDPALGQFCCDEGKGNACCNTPSKIYNLGVGTTFNETSSMVSVESGSSKSLLATSTSAKKSTISSSRRLKHSSISTSTSSFSVTIKSTQLSTSTKTISLYSSQESSTPQPTLSLQTPLSTVVTSAFTSSSTQPASSESKSTLATNQSFGIEPTPASLTQQFVTILSAKTISTEPSVEPALPSSSNSTTPELFTIATASVSTPSVLFTPLPATIPGTSSSPSFSTMFQNSSTPPEPTPVPLTNSQTDWTSYFSSISHTSSIPNLSTNATSETIMKPTISNTALPDTSPSNASTLPNSLPTQTSTSSGKASPATTDRNIGIAIGTIFVVISLSIFGFFFFRKYIAKRRSSTFFEKSLGFKNLKNKGDRSDFDGRTSKERKMEKPWSDSSGAIKKLDISRPIVKRSFYEESTNAASNQSPYVSSDILAVGYVANPRNEQGSRDRFSIPQTYF